jgi:hypothetical protein
MAALLKSQLDRVMTGPGFAEVAARAAPAAAAPPPAAAAAPAAAPAPEAAEPVAERSPKRQRVGAATEEETMASKERQLAFTRNVMTTLADVASNPALSDKEKEALRASLVAMLSRE